MIGLDAISKLDVMGDVIFECGNVTVVANI